MEKTIAFLDENGLGVSGVIVHSDVNETETSDINGIVTFADGKKTFTVDENSSPSTEVKSVITNFMIKTIS